MEGRKRRPIAQFIAYANIAVAIGLLGFNVMSASTNLVENEKYSQHATVIFWWDYMVYSVTFAVFKVWAMTKLLNATNAGMPITDSLLLWRCGEKCFICIAVLEFVGNLTLESALLWIVPGGTILSVLFARIFYAGLLKQILLAPIVFTCSPEAESYI